MNKCENIQLKNIIIKSCVVRTAIKTMLKTSTKFSDTKLNDVGYLKIYVYNLCYSRSNNYQNLNQTKLYKYSSRHSS